MIVLVDVVCGNACIGGCSVEEINVSVDVVSRNVCINRCSVLVSVDVERDSLYQ